MRKEMIHILDFNNAPCSTIVTIELNFPDCEIE